MVARIHPHLRRAKVGMLQAVRIVRWMAQAQEFPVPALASIGGLQLQHQIVVSTTGVQSHPSLETGKHTNLAIAAAYFDGRCISPDTPFSFWRILGRPTAAKGFRPGTEIRDGCVIPSIGGGLCLLSGALFRLAAEMGWQIYERHGHTVQGREGQVDATVFWPQVDLRFAPKHDCAVLRVVMQDESLIVESYGSKQHVPLPVWRGPTHIRMQNSEHPQISNQVEVSQVFRKGHGTLEVLGSDRKTTLPQGLARNCLTCHEYACKERRSHLRVMR